MTYYQAPEQVIYTPSGTPVTRQSERYAAMAAHLSALVAMLLSAGWLSFVGPLVVWLIVKEQSPYARHAAASSFNFNVFAWLMAIIGWVAFFTVVGIPLAVVLWLTAFFMTIWTHARASIAAYRGEVYRYPVQARLLN